MLARPANCRFPRDREVRLLHILDSTRYGFSPFAVTTRVTAALMLLFGGSVLARRPSRVGAAFFGMSAAGSVWLVAFACGYRAKAGAAGLVWWRGRSFG